MDYAWIYAQRRKQLKHFSFASSHRLSGLLDLKIIHPAQNRLEGESKKSESINLRLS